MSNGSNDTFENYCKECQDVSCPPKIYVLYAQLWELEFIQIVDTISIRI